MKLKPQNIIVSSLLLILLLMVMLVNISIFISGPNQKYEKKIDQVTDQIKAKNPDIKDITRHAFKFITYQGESKNQLLWFDENGKQLMKRDIDTYQLDNVKEIAMNEYGFKNPKILLGYGKKNAVYQIIEEKKSLYLDYDSLKKIYYLEG